MNHQIIGKQLAENIASGRRASRENLTKYIEDLASDLNGFAGTVTFKRDDDDFVTLLTGWPRGGIRNEFAFNSLEKSERLSRLCQLLEDFVSLLEDEGDFDRQVVILAEAQSLAFYTIGEAKEWREREDVSAEIRAIVERANDVCDLRADSAIAGAENPAALAFLAYTAIPGGITGFLDWKYFYQALRRFVEVSPASSIGVETVVSMLAMREEMVDSEILEGFARQCLRSCALPPHISIIADVDDGSEDGGDFTLDDTGLALTTPPLGCLSLEVGDIKTDGVESVDVIDEFGCDDEWSVKVGKFLDQIASGMFAFPVILRVSLNRNRLTQIVSRPMLRCKLAALHLDLDSGLLDVEAAGSLIVLNENGGLVVSQSAPAGIKVTEDILEIEAEALDKLFAKTLDLYIAEEWVGGDFLPEGTPATRFGE